MLEKLLHMLEHAIVVVSQDRRIWFRNAAAAEALQKGNGVAVVDGLFTVIDRGQELKNALRLACTEQTASSLLSARPGPESMDFHRLVVTPLDVVASDPDTGRLASVWIIPPEPLAARSERVLGALFGLSSAEARLAARLAAGDSLKRYAQERDLQIATVRSHLRNLFAKTRTRRQAELVALLSKVPPLRLPAPPP